MFDSYLSARAESEHGSWEPFTQSDYDSYVDGKPRQDGTRSFLSSRGISLPEGSPDDPPEYETIRGLGNRKNEIVTRHIRQNGVEAYPGSIRYLAAARAAGLRRAVVSSSANCRDVLAAAGIADEFEVIVDGVVAARDGLAGKPAPDTFLAAAHTLGLSPDAAAVFEDALSGVAAGRAGQFGVVIGVDRVGQAEQLRAHGADRVVEDLADLLATTPAARGTGD